MEHVEEKPAIIVAQETPSPRVPAERRIGAPSGTPKVNRRTMELLFMLVMALLLGLSWTVYSLSKSLSAASSGLREQVAQSRELAVVSKELKMEVRQLQRFLASTTVEDTIFLKMVILKPDLDLSLAKEIARHINHYAGIHGQDPDMVLALMATESGFNPDAVSSKGATGLMQVMPHWKKVLGITEDLKDPETSIKYGLQILGFYQEMYKDMEMALTAYNRGPGPVDMALMRERDHRNGYSEKVLKTYQRLKAIKVGKL